MKITAIYPLMPYPRNVLIVRIWTPPHMQALRFDDDWARLLHGSPF